MQAGSSSFHNLNNKTYNVTPSNGKIQSLKTKFNIKEFNNKILMKNNPKMLLNEWFNRRK